MKLKLAILPLVLSGFLLNAQLKKNNNPIINNKTVFTDHNGIISVEAEYFYKQSRSEIRQWYVTSKEVASKVGRNDDINHHLEASNSTYIKILPDTFLTAKHTFLNQHLILLKILPVNLKSKHNMFMQLH